jgi:LEA14-like dessication related protein
MTTRRVFLLVATLFTLGGCASLPDRDPIQVMVAGMESLPGEGAEIRMLVKLRVQNPNATQIDFTGAYVKLDVLGKTFASGVSDQGGTVPAFGETIVSVPVTVSVLRMVRQVVGMLDGRPVDKVTYEMSGKLSGGLFGTERFSAKGEFELPKPAPQTT